MRKVVAIATLCLGACVPVLESGDNPDDWFWEAPENTWPSSEPPQGLAGEGFYEGQVIPDFLLADQYGDDVSMWQFHGRVVVVDIGTMWCGPCRLLAEDAEATYQDYKDDGLIYLTVLPENVSGDDPTTEDLNLWVDEYGLTGPVVADPGRDWSDPAVPGNQYPVVLVVDTDMSIAERVDPPTDANIRAAVEGLLY